MDFTGNQTRILVFTTAYRPLVGGSEIALEQIVRHLPNIFFDILTPKIKSNLPRTEEGPNFKIYRLGFGGEFLSKIMFPILGCIKSYSITHKFDIKIVHSYQASYAGGAAWLTKIFNHNLKFVLTLQEGKDLRRQNFIIKFFRKLIIRQADKATAISHYLKDYLLSLKPQLPVTVIPNGVDIEMFVKNNEVEDIRRSLGIKQDERVIITVSRLVEKNGLSTLVNAFALVKKQISHSKLVIIGEGPERKNIESQISNFKLQNDVIMLGQIKHEKLPEYLHAADIFTRPSVTEGLGNVFLEAMAAGLPVVATSVGGIPDIISDGQTGIFCKVGDPDDLAEKIIRLLTRPELKNKIADQAKYFVSQKYDWQIIADEFKKFYHGV